VIRGAGFPRLYGRNQCFTEIRPAPLALKELAMVLQNWQALLSLTLIATLRSKIVW
jgi:hypothetical protein